MADAEATFSESIPACMGIRARMSAPLVQCADNPAPSVPSRIAILWSGDARSAATDARSRASGSRVSATVVKPSARSRSGAPVQSVSRAHGRLKTAPMLTLIARR